MRIFEAAALYRDALADMDDPAADTMAEELLAELAGLEEMQSLLRELDTRRARSDVLYAGSAMRTRSRMSTALRQCLRASAWCPRAAAVSPRNA